ncbi:hypothetical protein CEP54_011035 [Fusarium duplospermum]|uniref:F-box domain-containing protein n=1 Tax=Fusarium duplospermum TaxID=1325734 RepID=A0A428PGQ6_9HYPO|nr:hypothetical protein CEP54_011035 [Fusarium duplospermum]
MTSHLDSLPPELLSIITEHLGHDDRKNLSLANSTTRSAMVPFLFKGLKVKCPLPEDHILQEIVQKFGAHVLNLHLHVSFFPNPMDPNKGDDVDMDDGEEADDDVEDEMEEDENEESQENEDADDGSDDEAKSAEGSNDDDNAEENLNQEDAEDDENGSGQEEEEEEGEENDQNGEEDRWYWESPPESVWARKSADVPAVKDLIQFKGLPRCSILSLHTMGAENFEIEADWDDNDLCDSGMYFCSYEEDWDAVKKKEEKYTWRAALRDMWHDIANLSKTEHLEVFDFLPRKNSSWRKPEWSKFLGCLKELTLYTYGADNGAGWHVNTLPGFNDFFKELSSIMLRHAKHVERLKIIAHDEGFLNYDSLKLSPGIMPELQVLHLQHMAAPAILLPFLEGKPRNLREIHLKKCVAVETNDYDFELKTWASLWKTIKETGEKPIRVTYQYRKTPPLTEDENYADEEEDWKPPEDEEEGIARLRRMVVEDKDIIWPYVEIDEKYGMLMDNDVLNAEHLGMGSDNKEYRAMMDEMERRRKGVSVE